MSDVKPEPSACRRVLAGRRLAGAAFLVAGVAAIYGPVAWYDFVAFDDHHYILQSPVRKGLTNDGVVWAFTAFHSGNWHPLTWISHMLDVSLFGLRPGWHHLVSVGLHAANAVMLMVALDRLTGRWPESLVVAAAFAFHPLRVESVAWIAERKDVLSGLFFMVVLLAYERYARHAFSVSRLAIVTLAVAAGLMAKPMLVTLPCVLLLLDWWPLDRLTGHPYRCLLEKIPLFAMAAVSAGVTVLAQGEAVSSLHHLPWQIRFGNAAIALLGYLGSTFWPSGLAVLYPYDHAAAMSARVVWAAAVVMATTSVAIAAREWDRAVTVGWLWFCGMLFPVLGLVQVGTQPMADRFTYLPGIGLAIAVIFGGFTVARRLVPAAGLKLGIPRETSLVGKTAVAAAILCLAVTARRQVGFWSDTETLWRRAINVTRHNDRALDNLAWTLAEQGRMDEAAEYFAEGLAINPRRPDSANALGLHLLASGKPAAAADTFELAILAEPDLPQSHANLGIALARLGRTAAARAALERSISLDPAFVGGHYNLAQLYFSTGKIDAAERHLQEVVRLDPDHPQAAQALDHLRSLQRTQAAESPDGAADPKAAAP